MTDADAPWPQDPLGDRADRTPERLALIDAETGRTWTYAELDRFVDRIAAGLADAGITRGDTVATLLDSRPLTVGLPFATIRLGARLAPLNVELDRSTIEDQLDRLAPALLLCSAATEDVASSAFDGQRRSLDDSSTPNAPRFDPSAFDGAKEEGIVTKPATTEGLPADETALVVFTSGTTGRPKGVRLTLGNLLSSAAASATRLGVTPRDRWLSPLSTYHVGGLAPFVRSTLYGTAAVLQREFAAEATADAMDRHDVTCVSLVPTMLRRLLDAGWRPGPDFRFVLLGGGPTSDSLLERCLDHDVPVCPTYGATETASQVATATPGETLTDPGTVGRPLAETTVDIVDDGSPCSPGTVGELVVDGPTVSPGYLDESATEVAFEDGRFHTGDLGYRDAAGHCWIVGRADDVIVTGGENVRPSTVADALESHPAVEVAAVVGVPDVEWGERVAALVVATDDRSTDTLSSDDPSTDALTSEDLREWCRGRVPAFALPKSIHFADTLPRTPSGTVDREAVRERFQD